MTAAPKIEFDCPFCQARLRLAQEKAGKKVRCPHCREVSRAPQKSGGTAAKIAPKSAQESAAKSASPVPPSTPSGRGFDAGMLPGDDFRDAGGADVNWAAVDRAQPLTPIANVATDAGDSGSKLSVVGAPTTGTGTGIASGPAKKPTRRYQVMSSSGQQTVTDYGEVLGQPLVIAEGPPMPMPPAYATAAKRELDPPWELWVPVALVAAVIGGRYMAGMAPVGAVMGAAVALAVPMLWFFWMRMVFRKPAMVQGKVTSVIALGPWRLVALRWLTGGAGDGVADKHRLVLASAPGANFPTTDEPLVVMVPSTTAKWPAAIVPFHLARQIAQGFASPRAAEVTPNFTCPKCKGTGNRRMIGIIGGLGLFGAKALVLGNIVAAGIFGTMLFGVDVATVAWVAAIGAGAWWLVRRPIFRCDACRGRRHVGRLSRWTSAGSLTAWLVLMWVLLVPVGWRAHAASVQAPAIDGMIAYVELPPHADLATVGSDDLIRAGERAARVLAAMPEPQAVSVALGREVKPLDVGPVRVRHLGDFGPAMAEFQVAAYQWLHAVSAAGREPTDLNRLKALESAGTRLQAAQRGIEPLRHLGAEGPTLWFGPESLGPGQFDAAATEIGRYTVALTAPLRELARVAGASGE